MFTAKDIQLRSIFVINCLEGRCLRLRQGELLLEDTENKKTLTKLPFQKILALFVIGHITLTSPLIEKCRKYGIFISVMKPNLRPVFIYGDTAEANYLVRERQYSYDTNNIALPKHIIRNKINNQRTLLEKTRKADIISLSATRVCDQALSLIDSLSSYKDLMGLEGWAAKNFFSAYFQQLDWSRRMPRAKIDILNVTMDIGYTILFNYLESYIRMFGFDVYIGIYHRLWFKRKSLICDLIEPFRCIIDRQIRKSFNIGQFSENDFKKYKNEFYLKNECCKEYYNTFFSAIIEYKVDIFKYFQQYYRCFMSKKTADAYPFFNL